MTARSTPLQLDMQPIRRPVDGHETVLCELLGESSHSPLCFHQQHLEEVVGGDLAAIIGGEESIKVPFVVIVEIRNGDVFTLWSSNHLGTHVSAQPRLSRQNFVVDSGADLAEEIGVMRMGDSKGHIVEFPSGAGDEFRWCYGGNGGSGGDCRHDIGVCVCEREREAKTLPQDPLLLLFTLCMVVMHNGTTVCTVQWARTSQYPRKESRMPLETVPLKEETVGITTMCVYLVCVEWKGL